MAVDAPNAFAYPVNVPTELVAALHTGRADLVNLVQPRLLMLEEHRAYLDLIKCLIQTHYELRTHAVQMADQAKQLNGSLKGMATHVQRMIDKAEFRQEVEVVEDR